MSRVGSATVSEGIAFLLYVDWRIRRRRVCACKMFGAGSQRGSVRQLVVFAKKRRRTKKQWRRPWWKAWFSDWNDEEESLSGWREDDELLEEVGSEEGLSDDEKFETWKRKAEAIVELREARKDAVNAEGRSWEDWIGGGSGASGDGDGWGGDVNVSDLITDDPAEIVRDRGLIETFKDSIDEDYNDMLFEDRVFLYASTNSAKFLALLIVIPWVLDFLVHDYVLMPFLERYVQKVPLAAELLDVRRSQKLQMVKDINTEKARYRFEVEIGKSPPLSDDELWSELREKAIELRDEWRLENRKAFANIWSDMVYGISLFLLMYFNQSKVCFIG
ncbi:hypothetical protein E2562_023004 [Oryza meyeriana var. granulata]|uniref:Chloroplast envelope membrane protein n=1 Tax=Oryza meyeriana var. granulata TaxID=110450 RepID=A0A6G1EYI6_9ORYZ|nr:hypothetical protein E2562_023004 [Oryza meyeriana var. granulata]